MSNAASEIEKLYGGGPEGRKKRETRVEWGAIFSLYELLSVCEERTVKAGEANGLQRDTKTG